MAYRAGGVENAHGATGAQREAQAPGGCLAEGKAAGIVGQRDVGVVAYVAGGGPCVEAAGGLRDGGGWGGGAGGGGAAGRGRAAVECGGGGAGEC